MHTPRVDALVVGAGPTGTALAIDLKRRGHSVRVIDKDNGSFPGSRAKGVQPRSLEILDDLGAVDAILDGGTTYPLMGLHLGPLTIPWRMFAVKEPTSAVPYPNTWLIPQNRTVSTLHARLAELGVTIEFGTTVTAVDRHDDRVEASVEKSRGTETITARYLIGADGGASAVRKSQGIGFEGTTDDADRMIIVDAATAGLSRDRWHIWPRRGGKFIGACPLPHGDQFQWMIRVDPDAQISLDNDDIVELIHGRTRNKAITIGDISWKSLFRPNIRLADDYRHGRVFIAGDAAHVHTPAGAQGMNTGLQDAYNLGWKLSQVLAGAPEGLLDTYQQERQPIAARVLGLSTQKYEGIAKLDPSALKRGDDEHQLTLTYRGGPLATSAIETTTGLRAGDRAPDAVLVRGRGGRQRLFDLFHGPHFTLMSYGASSATRLAQISWPTSGDPLVRVAINAATTTVDDNVVALADSGGDFARSYGADDRLILVRPDGYIAAVTTVSDIAPLRQARELMVPSRL